MGDIDGRDKDDVEVFLPLSRIFQSCCSDLNAQWLPPGKDTIEYFTLKDLWDCYYEWSAFGAGIPMILENGDTLVQYYAPYLSATQIYISKSRYICRKKQCLCTKCVNKMV